MWLKIDFKLHFECTMKYKTFTLWWEKLLQSTSKTLRKSWHRMCYTMHPSLYMQYTGWCISYGTMLNTMGASAASRWRATPDNGEWPCWRAHRYLSHICCTAVGMLRLAVGLEEALHVLATLHCNSTCKLLLTLVNVYSREHPDALFFSKRQHLGFWCL